ncbi:MAG: 3-oxoacyl-ACP synthase [Sciscionella sp.]|nr:3-oxoacyl-ACP synthase [Sciscionella sp.]
MIAPVKITSWAVCSPFGLGRDAFAAGLRAGTPKAGQVDEFVISEALGKKGTSSMDRASALAVHTVGELLSGVGQRVPLARTGVVIGTTSGSARTQMEFTKASLTRRKPYFVEPAMMPFGLMNSAAAQCAIRHGLTGPNSTIATGRVAGLSTVDYAARWLAAGRADAVACGAVEEYSAERAWLAANDGGDETAPIGEGCAVVLLEPADSAAPALADVLAVRSRLALGDDHPQALSACLREAFTDVGGVDGVGVNDVGAVATVGAGERAVVEDFLGTAGKSVRWLRPTEYVGDTGAASASFAIAALLASARRDHEQHGEQHDERAGRLALVTATDVTGIIGCALLRLR